MKKFFPYLLAIILTVIFVSGCYPIFPLDKDQFDLGDTIQIHIGEKLYESDNLWIRVDSIKDGRCPIGLDCFWAGEAEVWLTVSYNNVVEQCRFSTYFDSLKCQEMVFGSRYSTHMDVCLIDVDPYPVYQQTIKESDIYASFVMGFYTTDKKPNLYLYPEEKTKMSVSMEFPHGGKVIESDPAYPAKWENIKVKPDGTINKKYDYLFYECEIPDFWQYVDGWVVKQEDLSGFFEQNLAAYGFNEKEIKDFVDFWIPELKEDPYYMILPQYTEMVNQVIKLWITPRPDKLMRLHYVISGMGFYFELPEPEIPDFEREGFTAVEWGVILK
jgi:hypothetical protein